MTMPYTAGSNGHARHLDVLRLGETTEERRPVEINGRTLQAWVVTNGRYPSSVAAELDDARNAWRATRQPMDPSTNAPADLWISALKLADLLDQKEIVADADIVQLAREVAGIARSLQEEPEMRSPEVDWQAYLTQALCILIPGLETHEADMLPPDVRFNALMQLGYMHPRRSAADPGVDESPAEPTPEDGNAGGGGGVPQNPPEAAESSIGGEREPVSAASTE